MDPQEFKGNNGQRRLNNWKKKQMHDQYMREINEKTAGNVLA